MARKLGLETHTREVAKRIRGCSDVDDLAFLLEGLDPIDVTASEDVRNALIEKAKMLFCILRRRRLEGRAPPPMSWIVTFPEFLSDNIVQNEMRRLGHLEEIFSEFARALDSTEQGDETRETIKTLIGTPHLADYAWNEIFKSSLAGVVNLIATSSEPLRDIALVLEIGTALRNPAIVEEINRHTDALMTAIAGRKNPVLARVLLGATSLLAESPWSIATESERQASGLDEALLQTIIGRYSKSIPSKEQLLEKADKSYQECVVLIEDMIFRMGWVFTRQYLFHMAQTHDVATGMLFPIALSQDPLGRIRPEYVLYCLNRDIPLPYQILQSALGVASEYVLDIDIIEHEIGLSQFEADCPDIYRLLKPNMFKEHHLINSRTGLRLDETYLGVRGIVRLLLQRDEDSIRKIGLQFLEGMVQSPNIPTGLKKRAIHNYRLASRAG